jgi:2,3-bisphosphoglycerate-independent phosphoglycerate mutase
VSGAVIAAVDLIRGIAKSVGMALIDVPGATGFLDTDYAGKGRAAAAGLETHDLIVVHVEAPDEAGHLGDAAAKITALERIDEHVVGPLLDELRQHDRWRVLVAPDHPTPVQRRVHTSTPPPFGMAGFGIEGVSTRQFCEAAALRSDWLVDPGCELMEYFLRVQEEVFRSSSRWRRTNDQP